MNLIKVFSKGEGTFMDINIITKDKDEPLYNWLSGLNDSIKISEGIENTPKLSDFDKEYNHLVIWDDLVLNKPLTKVEDYYIRARKKHVSLCFLSQSYADIPKMIRKNSDYLILFDLGGSTREQNYIMREWSGDLEKEQLRAIYNDAVSEKLNPLIIQGGKVEKNKKYRKGFLDYYNLDEFLSSIPKEIKKKKNKKVYYSSDEYDDSD